ncbi:hypothetical protein SUGI_0813860 [Cryptomeria japonica]|nr:hypothetical protein SUGI_0813860 [Cryptomeria japonica]
MASNIRTLQKDPKFYTQESVKEVGLTSEVGHPNKSHGEPLKCFVVKIGADPLLCSHFKWVVWIRVVDGVALLQGSSCCSTRRVPGAERE